MQRGNLNARGDAYVPKVYSERLDELIDNPDVKNIAVTAPYDSGKTTILKSYFKKRESKFHWNKKYINGLNSIIHCINVIKQFFLLTPNLLSPIRDYEFINIPNFFDVSNSAESNLDQDDKSEEHSNINDETKQSSSNVDHLESKLNTETQLEKSIIEQLLYKPNTRKYPDSNLNRLKTHSLFSISINFVYAVFLFSYVMRIFGDKNKLKWWNSLPMWNNFRFQIISILIIAIGSWKLFGSLTHSLGKVKLHATTKMGPLELSGDTETKDGHSIDLFNYYGDELQYYFKKNNIKVVIFEDLDRFNSPLIFQKLRELNSNLNKSGNNITFIYSLKDKVFSINDPESNPAALKAKFFDAVIPIFPIHSYRDSSKTFINEGRQYGLVAVDNKEKDYFEERDKELDKKKAANIKIDNKYLRGLGLYIPDTREIKNIISETYFYFSELPLKMFDPEKGGSPKVINKLLAMVVYKNECPEDFDNLASGKESKLEDFIGSIKDFKSVLLNTETDDNNNKIKELNSKIEALKSKLTTDLNVLMRIRLQELVNENNGLAIRTTDDQYYSSNDNIDKIHEFWKKVLNNNLKYRTRWGTIEEIDNIDQVEHDLFKSYLFDNIPSNEVLSQWNNSKEKLENKNEQLRKDISNLEIKDLLIEYSDNKVLFSDKLNIKVNEGIKFITSFPVLEYLVKQGLIGYDYTDYISLDPYNLTSAEDNFVRLVINHQKISNPDYRLSRVDRVIKEINLLDGSVNTYKYAYSPDILIYFLGKENKDEYINSLVASAYHKNQPEFILVVIETLINKTDDLTRLFNSISKEWSNYYTNVFNIKNSNLEKRLARQLLYYLSDHNSSNQVFNSLKDQKIFENSEFEEELLVLNEDIINKIFESQDSYKYSDLTFVAEYSLQKLKLFVSHGWYEENSINFKIIFNEFTNHNLNIFLNDFQKELNISNKFIQSEIFDYYSNEKNATYEDMLTLLKYLSSDNLNDSSCYLKILEIYLNDKNKFDEQEKKKLLLEDLHLVELINKKKFTDTELLSKLLEQDKLIYDKQIFDALYNNYEDFSKKYAVKFESNENITYLYGRKHWSFIISCLEDTKFPSKWIKAFDEDADLDEPNVSWINNKPSDKALKLLANNTSSTNVMREVIKLASDFETKIIILKNIFNKSQFEHQFTKQEISELIFADPDFIDSWSIDGKKEVVTPEQKEKYQNELQLLYENVPQEFKKKGTKRYIFLKKFDDWFKKDE